LGINIETDTVRYIYETIYNEMADKAQLNEQCERLLFDDRLS
jgi:hypothetical protein